MSTVLEPPITRRPSGRAHRVRTPDEPEPIPTEHRNETTAAQRLRTTMAAVRLSFTWFGVRKSLTLEQKARAADAFGAEGEFVSAGKKLLDTKHPAYKAVTAVKNRIKAYWKALTLPYTEPGTRLIRQDWITEFDARTREMSEELLEAVGKLDRYYADLRSSARRRLGTLYNPADYPDSLMGLFSVDWEYPSVEPPDYLRQANPELYEQECRRVAARFDEALRLAEEAFIAELEALVAHLTERLSGQDDGRPKIFRDTAVTNLGEFFQRFRELNVGSNEQLDRMVEQAEQLTRGVEPQTLRTNDQLRQHVAAELSRVRTGLDGLMVERPRRRLLRTPR